MSTFSFTHRELHSLPKEILIELLAVVASSVEPLDLWATRISEWLTRSLCEGCTRVSELPEWVDISLGWRVSCSLDTWAVDAYAVFVAADVMPYSVYRLLAPRIVRDGEERALEPDFCQYHQLLKERAAVQRSRASASQSSSEQKAA